jgi:DNA-binding CsgD family transcriptional regulator/tetratricopeptide (TPR) repeat protein
MELETQLIGIARHEPELQALAAERLERLRTSLPRLSSGREVVLANLASEAARSGVGRAEAVDHAERALAGGSLLRAHFDPEFIFAVGTLTSADRLDEALRLYAEAIEDARERGLAIQFCVASCFRSAVAFQRGALADAVADAELCLGAIESNGLEMIRPGASAFLAQALIERGEVTRARQALDSARAAVDAIESTIPMHISYFDARARLRLVDGDHEQAFHELVARGRRADEFGFRNPALFAWRSRAALALLGLGRNDEARRYAGEELALSRQWGSPRSVGKSLIAAGLAEGGDEGIALLRDAVTVLEPSEVRLEHARALVELGSALRRANQRSAAREPLRQGLELATACGALPLAERAESELLATGARPRRIALSGVDSLTPSEKRVAEMAAGGDTNREIAQALFVTPKTVEVHLSSVYRKLGVSARSQLSKAFESA